MPIKLPDLPYQLDALEPHMSKETLHYHYGKHHRKYVDTTNELIAGTELENESIEKIVRSALTGWGPVGLFDNSAQVWNHTFFWNSMKPGGGGEPQGEVAKALDEAFGGYSGFKEAFLTCATQHFGSGWVWLVLKDGTAEVISTKNADTPLVDGPRPILTCDVWEHTYYLDYRNEKDEFVEVFLDKLVNWDFVAEQLAAGQDDAPRDAA